MEEKINISDALKLAVEYHKKGELNYAKEIYEKIIEVDSENANALHLLGLVFYELKEYSLAAEKIEKAVQIKPNSSLFFGNLGMIYDVLGEDEKAARNFIKALEINPNYNNAKLAHYNLGVYYKDKGELNNALEYYNNSIRLDNNFFEALWNRALILLLLGDFEKGWKDYGCRFKKKDPADSRVFSKPKWEGSDLNGKKILVLSEQGFGDNIQFIRYLSLIKQRNGKIILECPSELRGLFEQFSFVDEFVSKEEVCRGKFDFDVYVYLLDLPYIFNTNLNNVPNKIPYLFSNKELSDELKRKLTNKSFKIGIAWAGNPNQANNKNRSTVLDNFRFLKQIPNVSLYSLQKGEGSDFVDKDIINLSEFIKDFSDTAGIINELDLIISVDTSVAHLAGALGKPVWVLLSFIPDWRWLLYRKDSPWYPGMKLFRQDKLGDWESVFRKVESELKDLLSPKEDY